LKPGRKSKKNSAAPKSEPADGRALFKLNQSEVVQFNLGNLELVAQEVTSRDSRSSTRLEMAGVRAAF